MSNNNTQTFDIKLRPKFVVDTETAYRCITLLEIYCESHNKTLECTLSRYTEDRDAEWHTSIEIKNIDKDIKGEQNE